MKRALLILIVALTAQAATVAHAAEGSVNILLTGGPETDVFIVKLSADGTTYLVSSATPLEAPSGICTHQDASEKVLACAAASVAGFEVDAGDWHDYVVISPKVPVPVTLRGGPGDDHLYGGAAADKLIGGAGNDSLHGRGGGDWLYGGPGNDIIFGGPGDDRLLGGAGMNEIFGGSGKNQISPG